ncbi:hypothetical protein DDN77_17700 [Vibrio cholerae]|nr:hypothetical protein [Vibrio cholerae]EGR4155395.1 hypothetical protein [Vibrio cholerae]EGR4418494.1 hypothetical protein [Vibrio cholerae]
MSTAPILIINESTKPLVLQTVNLWLIKQEDYHKDFLFTDFKLIDGDWRFIALPCTDKPIMSDTQNLTDRMCKELGYQVIR